MEKTLQYRENYWDVLLGIFCLFLGGIGLQVVNDSNLWRELMSGSSSQSVGTVSVKGGNVRHRYQDSPIWRDLIQADINVAEGDAIFTGDTGKADLALNDGNSASILENSLIVVHANKNVSRNLLKSDSFFNRLISKVTSQFEKKVRSINIKQGQMQVRLKDKKDNLEVTTGDKVFQIETQGSEGNMKISVQQTEAGEQVMVTTEKDTKILITDTSSGAAKSIDVKEGQSAILNSTKSDSQFVVNTIPFKTLTPANNETLTALMDNAGQPSTPVTFKWKALDSKSAGELTHSLEIDGSRQATIAATQDEQVLNVTAGSHRWRIASVNSDGKQKIFTDWNSFNVEPLSVPHVLSPGNNHSYLSKTDVKVNVIFSWKALPSSQRAEIEIFDKNGKKIESELFSQNRSFHEIKLPPGEYRWHIRAQHTNDVTSSWSGDRLFRIVDKFITYPTVNLVAQSDFDTFKVNSSSLDEKKAKISWTPLQGVKDYQVIIFRSGEKDKEFVTTETSSEVILNSIHENIKFKVSAILPDGRLVESDVSKINYRLDVPTPKYPIDVDVGSFEESFYITWSRTPLSEGYDIEVARDSGFLDVELRKNKIQDNYHQFKPSKPGTYYWRVRSTTAKKKGSWSAETKFKVSK